MSLLELPSCQRCLLEFSSQIVPLLLPDCGHSVCYECIKMQLDQGIQIFCKEDNIQVVNRSSINDFPKNHALLQAIQTQQATYSPSQKFRLTQAPTYDSTPPNFINQNKQQDLEISSSSNSDRIYISSENKEQLNAFLKVKFKSQLSSDGLSCQAEEDICQIHKMKYDVLCLQCREKICPNCAIFAGHKTHELLMIENAVQMIGERAELMADLYGKIEEIRIDTLNIEQYQLIINNQFNEQLQQLIQNVDVMFVEIQQQVQARKQRLINELKEKSQQIAQGAIKQMLLKLNESSRTSDLWCYSTKAKLDYFTRQTERGDIPLDLLFPGDDGLLQMRNIGHQVLDELNESKQILQQKLKQVLQRRIHLEKRNLNLDGLFDLVIINQNTFQGSPAAKFKSIDNESQVFEHSLLKDINNCQIVDPFVEMQQIQQQRESNTPEKMSLFTSNRKLEDSSRKTSVVSRSPMDKLQRTQNSKARPVSPSPIKALASKSKLNKLPEKFKIIFSMLKADSLEMVDFTGAELGDEALNQILPYILSSQNLKSLKLVKNKISDSGATNFMKQLLMYQNADQYSLPTNILATVNLSNNMLTDKFVDYILNQTLKNFETIHVQSLKHIYLNQNLINSQRVKKKIEELKKLGIILYV